MKAKTHTHTDTLNPELVEVTERLAMQTSREEIVVRLKHA